MRRATNVGKDEDFSMRAVVRGIGLRCVLPALENLSGRKPRGLGKVYGESAKAVGVEAAATPSLGLAWLFMPLLGKGPADIDGCAPQQPDPICAKNF